MINTSTVFVCSESVIMWRSYVQYRELMDKRDQSLVSKVVTVYTFWSH